MLKTVLIVASVPVLLGVAALVALAIGMSRVEIDHGQTKPQ
jgi:hypothetical protein